MTEKHSTGRALAVPTRRLSRIGGLGAMTAGVAGNMAVNGLAQVVRGQRPRARDLLLTPRNVTKLADQLAQMRGAAMKIGQLVSMDTGEVLPPELAQIMARLRDDAHFMPPAQLKQVLNSQWPAGWLSAFAKFDVRPVAAASIGQVHHARLKDGRDLAIKVQYPGVAESIDSDVANVGALIRMSGLLPKGFELAPYLADAAAQLREETDYVREGTMLTRFAGLMRDDPDFVTPALVPEWSTSNILAMTYMAGTPIEDVARDDQRTRDRIAAQLVTLTLKELFAFGVMQTDPNFANYLYDPETERIVLLDFGATREISPATADQYRRLLRAGLAQDVAGLEAVAGEIGLLADGIAERHRAQIVRMMQMVFAALQAGEVFDFADMTLSRQMQAEGIALAKDGFVPPVLPIDVLLLQRKFGGVFLLANRLGAKVDVVGLLESFLTD